MRGYLWYPDTRGNTSLRISPCVFMRFSDTERSYLQTLHGDGGLYVAVSNNTN